MRKWILLAATVAMLATPPASAQAASTPTTLYFHVFNTFDKFPINTQPMDVDFFEVGGTNFPTWEAQGWDFNTIYGYSTAGPVEYDFIENGRPRFHPEHGIAADVDLDDSVQPVVYFYIDVRDVVSTDGSPMLLPYYTVEVTMRTGDDPGDTAALDAGEIIMAGKFTAHLADAKLNAATLANTLWGDELVPDATGDLEANDGLAGQQDADGIPFLVPDEHGIIEYAIPMDVSQWTIPKADAYNIRIDWYQDPKEDSPDETATGWMRLAADVDHLPRMELAVKNPVYVEFVHPQVAAGTLLIHTGVNSPWGTYDLDVSNMTLTIKDKQGSIVKQHNGVDDAGTGLERFVSQGAHVHDQHDKAAEITYMWDFRAEKAKDGEYTIDLTVPNLDNSATASATAKFIIEGKKAFGEDEDGNIVEPADEEKKGKGSPGPLVLLPLGLAGIALRRWRQ